MKRFDYSFLENGNVPATLLNVTNNISLFKQASDARKEKFQDVFTELEKIAKVQSIKSSNAIEGIVTTDKRIQEIVNGNSAPLNHNEAEIAGYRDCLNEIHSNHAKMQFNEATILSLHKKLVGQAGYDYGGEYKREDNVILEIDAFGNRRVRFRPVPAEDTPAAMEQLVLAYQDASNNYYISPLLLIPCVILDFLCIHPFKDGNGRMSRLLSLLLLYKAGFDAGKYISFEEQINRNKDLYYAALQESSTSWIDNNNDYFPFVSNFLVTLMRCYSELDTRFAVVNSRKVSKKGRIEATILNSIGPMTKGKLKLIHPDISITTIEAVLSDLLKKGIIEKIGTTHNAKYIRTEKAFNEMMNKGLEQAEKGEGVDLKTSMDDIRKKI